MTDLSLPKGIRKRGDSYLVDVTRNGTRRTATELTIEAAKRKRREILDELEDISSDPFISRDVSTPVVTSKRWTLKQAVDKTMELPAPEGWAGSKSLGTHEKCINAALEYFGPTKRLDAIDEDALDTFVSHLKTDKRNSNATINRKLSALSKVFKVAKRKKGVAQRPEFPGRLTEGRGRIRQIHKETEETQLLALLERLGVRGEADLTELMIYTGLRCSEALALSRRDVDFKSKVLLVHGRNENGTKNGEIRSVPIGNRLRRILQKRMNIHDHNRLWEGLDYPTFYRNWNRARLNMGLTDDPDFVPHVCRHTCASRLVQRGTPIKIVQEWLGHKSIQMTMRYAHLYPENLVKFANSLDD